MGSYRVLLDREAEAEFRAVPFPVRRQINQRIGRLKEDPRPVEAQRFSEQEFFRLAVGPYRVLYEVDDAAATVTILAVREGSSS